eukprot:8104530-Pyramimonas_sp.AAC.1
MDELMGLPVPWWWAPPSPRTPDGGSDCDGLDSIVHAGAQFELTEEQLAFIDRLDELHRREERREQAAKRLRRMLDLHQMNQQWCEAEHHHAMQAMQAAQADSVQ